MSVWCRRDAIFSKQVLFGVDERTLDFCECAFGVDETLVGECSFLTMYVLRRRDAILQNAFAIVAPEITILDGARWRDPLPKVGVWCGRDVIFQKKLAFGVDETPLDF